VLTVGARGAVSEIHDRMPLILMPEAFDPWLDPACHALEELRPLLRAPAAEELVLFPVSARVNSPANDDAACLLPPNDDEVRASSPNGPLFARRER
jgi:putative SOS response-associated peptidase YedK